MDYINEDKVSGFLCGLIEEASSVISPGKVRLAEHDNLPYGVDVQTIVEDTGDYAVLVRPESLGDEYKISHEILHICVRKHVPSFVRVLEPNIIGIIGTELQGYLEHRWILAEQRRRGLQIDEAKPYPNIEETLAADQEGIEKNINTILTLNNIIHTHPEILEAHREFFAKNNPRSLEMSERIMSHYPDVELYSNYEARKATIKAIREWNLLFAENGMRSVNLSVLISVTPVFSTAQMNRTAGVILGIIPNAIVNNKNQTASHVLYTLNDGQCCVVFAFDDNGLRMLQNYLNTMTLKDFLETGKIPYLMR